MLPTHHIFISYARKDARDLALHLQTDLTGRGYNVWLDTAEIEGGASWSQEIEEAIEQCDVVLALLSAGSFTSEICRAEQLRALRKGKRVIPLLVQANIERPLHLEHLNYRDFSTPAYYNDRVVVLLNDLTNEKLQPLPAQHRQTLNTAPPLPTNFVARPVELDTLRRTVIGDSGKREIAPTALRGMGGIGKSVLATALCYDEVVQAAFPNGILWIEIGREPGNLVAQMAQIGAKLGDDPKLYSTFETSIDSLRTLLRDKAVLLVIDNVWEAAHVRPFLVDAPRCRLLLTTRDGTIALTLDAQEQRLDLLTPEQSIELLRATAGRDDPQFGPIAKRLDYLPLALKIAGAHLREGMRGAEWLATFQHITQIKLGRDSTDPQENLYLCLDMSVQRLAEMDRPLYYAFGIFPQNMAVPEQVIQRLWCKLNPTLRILDCSELLTQLARLELLQRTPERTITFHNLLYDYVRNALGDGLSITHLALLDAYNPAGKPWPTIAHDGYLYYHLVYHLLEAHRPDEVRTLLLNYQWLQVKLTATDINALITDYDIALHSIPFVQQPALQNETLDLLVRILHQAAHILTHDPTQLAPQLWGRLTQPQPDWLERLFNRFLRKFRQVDNEEPEFLWAAPTLFWERLGLRYENRRSISSRIRRFVFQIWKLITGSALPRSYHQLLLLRYLLGNLSLHASGIELSNPIVQQDQINNEIRRLLIDLQESEKAPWLLPLRPSLHDPPVLFRTLQSHLNNIDAIAMTLDGERAVAISRDGVLKMWDLVRGAELFSFRIDTPWDQDWARGIRWFRAVAVTPDGQRAISASFDGMLKIWNLADGTELRSLQFDHSDVVTITPDGQRAVSVSYTTLHVWDLTSGAKLSSIGEPIKPSPEGRRSPTPGPIRRRPFHIISWPRALAVTPDCQRAVSVDDQGIIRVWDLARGSVYSLQGDQKSINTLVVTSDGQRAAVSQFGTFIVWDLVNRKRLYSQRINNPNIAYFKSVAGLQRIPQEPIFMVTSDGQRAVTTSSNEIMVWSLSKGNLLSSLKSHTARVSALAMTLNGQRVISAALDGTIKVWDLNHIVARSSRQGHTRRVSAIGLTPDGQRAISRADDGTLKVWDVINGCELYTLRDPYLSNSAELRILEDHSNKVNRVTVSGNELWISISTEHRLEVWDLATQSCLAAFQDDGTLNACAVTPDGRTIVVGGASGRVHFLRLENI